MAYQLHLGEEEGGLVVVLKRPGSARESLAFPLNALRPGATYTVADLDTGESGARSAESLISPGLEVRRKVKPDSARIRHSLRKE